MNTLWRLFYLLALLCGLFLLGVSTSSIAAAVGAFVATMAIASYSRSFYEDEKIRQQQDELRQQEEELRQLRQQMANPTREESPSE